VHSHHIPFVFFADLLFSRRSKRQLHRRLVHGVEERAASKGEEEGEGKEGNKKPRKLNGVPIVERRRLKEKGLWGRRRR
jgi:hypothetical protein